MANSKRKMRKIVTDANGGGSWRGKVKNGGD